MKSIMWKGVEMTTIAEIALFYSDGDVKLASELKPFIRTGLKKIKSINISKVEIHDNIELLRDIVPLMIPSTGITLIATNDIQSLEKYFISIIPKKANGTYKKDRFLSKRSLGDELKLELKLKKMDLEPEEFSSVMSYAKRLEIGQPKSKAIQHASRKFCVTQKRILEILDILDVSIDYKNKPKDHI